MKNLIIFDLDGTLLNTIGDLAEAVNHALYSMRMGRHPLDSYPFFVGNGITKLIERALPNTRRDRGTIIRARELFMNYYDENKTVLTKPYEGIHELLSRLHGMGISLAVASNKYQRATRELVDFYFPDIPFCAVYGQREGIPTKPDRRIVDDILSVAKAQNKDILYVGDSGVDIDTARNAGIASVAVTWGFRPLEELKAHAPTFIINSPEELLSLID